MYEAHTNYKINSLTEVNVTVLRIFSNKVHSNNTWRIDCTPWRYYYYYLFIDRKQLHEK